MPTSSSMASPSVASARSISPATATTARTCSTRTITRCATASGPCIAARWSASAASRRWSNGTIRFRHSTRCWPSRAARPRSSARSSMPALRDTEELLWKLITAPEGVADGLRRIDMKSDELGRVIAGDARLDAVQRLDIYANMYFWRLSDILRGDYSALVAAVGDDRFHNLVTDYLLDSPSTHPSVRNVGVKL